MEINKVTVLEGTFPYSQDVKLLAVLLEISQ